MIAPLDDVVSEQWENPRFADPLRSRVKVPTGASASAGKSKKPEEVKNPEPAAGAGETAEAPPDELPEEFELTPEVIEDEAMRNDFMLRLAVVLMAVLLACTEIGETITLVHVKTGQYLSSHGILPPRTDVLTDTAAETPWINLSWMFDLFSAATFAVGGAVGLTVVKTLLAGLAFYLLLKAVKRDVPTWWASICAGLALIVCAEQLTFEPQLITLLGLSITLWIVLRWRQADGPKTLWGLIPLFIVWSNMDPRAYLGLVVLMLLTLGEVVGMFLGRSFLADETKRAHLWIIVPVSLVAFLIHPFGWQTLLSPAYLYGTEYPAFREILQNTQPGSLDSYLPLTDPDFWRNLTLPVIAALVLAATVPVTFALNWRNVTPAHVVLYLGMVGIGLANSHDLAAVSVVFAALAALNAQMWYAESFRQSYSIEMSERVFSVGGRAVTAFAFFGLAFLAISGRLLGSEANRLGFGFRQSLASLISEIQKDLELTEIPGQGLNFSRQQGDVLIWLDRKPFIDNRISLHARGGEDSPLAEFQAIAKTWNALPPEENESQDDWTKRAESVLAARREKLKEHNIGHVIVPLGPRAAQYPRLRAFYSDTGEWRLVQLGSMAGWFYRMTPDAKQNQAYLEDHVVDFFKEAFQTPVEEVLSQPVLASAPVWTDKLFKLKANKPNSPETQLALHHRFLMLDRINLMQLQAQQGLISPPEIFRALAMGTLAIRHSHNALQEDPNAVMAYRALADTCSKLNALEEQIAQIGGGTAQANKQRRDLQAMVAYNQAIVASPDLPLLHLELGNLYHRNNRLDLAAREFDRFFEITGVPDPEEEGAQAEYERRLRFKKDVDDKVLAVQKEVDKHLENKVPAQQLAPLAYQHGCTLLALELLTQDGQLPQNDPFTLFAQLEAGLVEEAYFGLIQLEGQLEAQIKNARANQFGLSPNPSLRNVIALAALAVGDYNKAIEQWTRQAEEAQQRAMLNLMGTLPLVNRPVSPGPLFMQLQDDWQYAPWMTGLAVVRQMPQEAATPLWNAALCHLETGNPDEAKRLLKELLDVHPDTAYRPLAAFYIELITGESVPLEPPSMYIPVWEDMFAPGPALAEKPISKPPEEPKPEEPKPEKP